MLIAPRSDRGVKLRYVHAVTIRKGEASDYLTRRAAGRAKSCILTGGEFGNGFPFSINHPNRERRGA